MDTSEQAPEVPTKKKLGCSFFPHLAFMCPSAQWAAENPYPCPDGRWPPVPCGWLPDGWLWGVGEGGEERP